MKIITKKSEQKRIKEECWNLDFELINWVNEHLKVLVQECPKVIDLEYYKYKYKGKEYTQLQILERLIEITDILLSNEPYCCDSYTKVMTKKDARTANARKNEMYDLLKLVHWQLWW